MPERKWLAIASDKLSPAFRRLVREVPVSGISVVEVSTACSKAARTNNSESLRIAYPS
jgi:hypothetical protein